jgi:wyosine [tRNA(Phe)-imidazoG37] synthetase (radical SAM superfamily)
MFAFGPVPSRRLGRSLGVNHVPSKTCSYACVYCQVGPTGRTALAPRRLSDPSRVVAEVAERIGRLLATGDHIDVVTLVPEGEPTLDAGVGELIDGLRSLGMPVAVLTNGSLLHRPDVRERLARADVVSIKVDAATEPVWRRVNRPDPRLDFEAVSRGVARFARDFRGRLLTETMLVGGGNDGEDEVRRTAERVRSLGPAKAWLALPVRPASAMGVGAPSPAAWARARALFDEIVGDVGFLDDGNEEGDIGATGDAETDLLATTAVHPMTARQVADLLRKDGADVRVLARLIAAGRIHHVRYRGRTWFHLVHGRQDGGGGRTGYALSPSGR